ncbi:hypothetical protein AB0I84_44255 [Streptomyces spectabilis]|uniref:hypothetical protein n=1 Tax=Streptomyces spectabilis TaxID=68270 RepID=UPI0033C4C130
MWSDPCGDAVHRHLLTYRVNPTAYLRALRPRQSTFKIRTILGPPSANSPTNYAFTLVEGMQWLYSQQTKNLLVSYSPKKLGFF